MDTTNGPPAPDIALHLAVASLAGLAHEVTETRLHSHALVNRARALLREHAVAIQAASRAVGADDAVGKESLRTGVAR